MKITKAKLKQIIKEELSSLSEADAFSHHSDGWDAGGTSQQYSTDVRGLPAEEQVDPVVQDIVKLEEYGTMIRNKFPGEYPEHLEAIDRIHDRLKGMQTGAGNEVALAMDS